MPPGAIADRIKQMSADRDITYGIAGPGEIDATIHGSMQERVNRIYGGDFYADAVPPEDILLKRTVFTPNGMVRVWLEGWCYLFEQADGSQTKECDIRCSIETPADAEIAGPMLAIAVAEGRLPQEVDEGLVSVRAVEEYMFQVRTNTLEIHRYFEVQDDEGDYLFDPMEVVGNEPASEGDDFVTQSDAEELSEAAQSVITTADLARVEYILGFLL